MPNSYRVSIRIEGITTGGGDGSKGYSLTEGLELKQDGEHLLKVRIVHQEGVRGDGIHYISDPIIYLDIDVVAESINHAVPKALTIARRFTAVVAFTHHYSFQINLAGGIPIVLLPDMINLGPFTYVNLTSSLASFEEVEHVWNTLSKMDERMKDSLELALEWMHIGLIESDEKAKFLAYWIGLELLMRDNEPEIPKVLHQVPEEKRKALIAEVEDILKKCTAYLGENSSRLVKALINADAERPAKRWSEALKAQDVPISEKEVDAFYKTRNALTHSGSEKKDKLPTKTIQVHEVKEIVMQYTKRLLETDSTVEKGKDKAHEIKDKKRDCQ